MKKIVFFLFLLFSLTSQAQNKFPSVDSLQNYTYRYVKNSSVESFTNLRLQNILIGLSQMVDTLRNAGYVDSIWIGADDTLKYRIGNTTFKVGKISGGGSTDSSIFATRYWTTTQYQPIGTYLQTASNGLTSSGTDVKLGGTLTGNTTINTNGNRLTINSAASDPKYTIDFGSSGIYIGKTNSGNHWVSVDDNEASMYYVSGPDESTGVSVRADSVFLQKYDNFTTPKKQVFAPTTTDTSSFQILAINKTTGSLVRYTGAWPSPTDISGKLNISDTSSMLSPYLPSNVAAATYQPIGSYLTTGTLTDSLNANGVTGITLNTPNVIFSTPVTFSKTGRSWSGTLSLNNQSANTILAGPSSGSAATPTFRSLVAADIPDLSSSYVTTTTYNNAVLDSGWVDWSGSSNIVGWSSYTIKSIRYKRTGKIIQITYSISGTSNSASTSFTLPYTTSASFTPYVGIIFVQNNGTSQAGRCILTASSATITFNPEPSGGSSFVSTGTKQVTGQFIYEIQ